MALYESRNDGTPFNGGGFFKSFLDNRRTRYVVTVHVSIENLNEGLLSNRVFVGDATQVSQAGSIYTSSATIYITYDEGDQTATYTANRLGDFIRNNGPQNVPLTHVLCTLVSGIQTDTNLNPVVIDNNKISLSLGYNIRLEGFTRDLYTSEQRALYYSGVLGSATLLIDLSKNVSEQTVAYSDLTQPTTFSTNTYFYDTGVAGGRTSTNTAIRLKLEVTDIQKSKVQ